MRKTKAQIEAELEALSRINPLTKDALDRMEVLFEQYYARRKKRGELTEAQLAELIEVEVLDSDSPTVLMLEQALKELKRLKREAPSFTHDTDYQRVTCEGTQYTFTPQQAQVIKLLHDEWKAGRECVKKKPIHQAYYGSFNFIDLPVSQMFKHHPAWNTLVRACSKKGFYRIDIPSG
ncbi:MAG: hypothetical protein O3A51_02925 [Verrucomicrobia bacterium]|nr:hypothetical protein [Verrucomicrobiota bacterium]